MSPSIAAMLRNNNNLHTTLMALFQVNLGSQMPLNFPSKSMNPLGTGQNLTHPPSYHTTKFH